MDDTVTNIDSYGYVDNFDIAIIGISGRFPGAKNLDEYWKNLVCGKESITFFNDSDLIKTGIEPEVFNQPSYIKAAPVLDGPGMFDASFFGYSPAEAAIIDPQQRLLLECAWEALENAGYDTEKLSTSIGIFAGSAMNTYFMNDRLYSDFVTDYIPTLIANDKDFLCTRISYKLNLKGPSVTVQTACSTALVAVHMACQSLLNEECDMALAGAMSVKVPHIAGYFYRNEGVVSPDGHCRPFDAAANGCVFGSGGGIVVLKKLDKALRDGDAVYAIIKGSAVNNDGAEKVGYTAPSVTSQTNVIIEAQANAGIHPETITYIEAHGSGTSMGDPIEVRALTNAFRLNTEKNNFCALGSVKSNIGHLDVAAGTAGLIKTILALKHKKIPPTLHFSAPNPLIDLPNSPFFVNNNTIDWNGNNEPLRAGISASGMGGTNAHIIVEEAPIQSGNSEEKNNLLILSAKSSKSLETTQNNLCQFLKEHPGQNLTDVAYTLQVGRREFSHRYYLIAKNNDDVIKKLKEENRNQNIIESGEGADSRLVFLFPGIGDHYVGMGYELYQNEQFFRQEVDRCAEILKRQLEIDILDVLYPEDFLLKRNDQESQGINLKKMLFGNQQQKDMDSVRLNEPLYSQTILFSIEYALARLWMHWGVKPDVMIGHSLGEYVAACLSGVFSLEDALLIVSKRAQLVQELPEGAMIAVTLSEKDIQPFLKKDLSISLINGPELCVVAGPEEQISAMEIELNQKDIITRRIENSHAFHSKMLLPIVEPFSRILNEIEYNTPKIPFISNVNGQWINNSSEIEPGYWARHATQTVRFNDALELLWKEENNILLEVGPGLTLSTLAIQHPAKTIECKPLVISSLRPVYNNQDDTAYILNALGKLWLNNQCIQWDKLHANKKRLRVPLPTYPFERQLHWLEASPGQSLKSELNNPSKKDINSCLYIPSWKRIASIDYLIDKIDKNTQPEDCWLLFMDSKGVGNSNSEKLDHAGQEIIKVYPGNNFKKITDNSFEINFNSKEEYNSLFSELASIKRLPGKIIHCWYLEDITDWNLALDKGFYSLFYLVKAIGEQNITKNIQIVALSSQIYDVVGSERIIPEKATMAGICKVIPKEYSNIVCKNLDVVVSDVIQEKDSYLVASIIAEACVNSRHSVIAYRGNHRWVECFEPLYSQEILENESIRNLKMKGVYMITGGLGGLGLHFAGFLAGEVKAKLILIGRSEFPKREEWLYWLNSHDNDDSISKKIKKIQAMEEEGAEVLVATADVGDKEKMNELISSVQTKFGDINGVLHAAGVIEEGIIQLKQKDEVSRVLDPKLNGTRVIYELLENQKLDFFILFSSIASFMAPAGDSDYCAANTFLDIFAQKKISQMPGIISINWPVWKDIGILPRHQNSNMVKFWNKKVLETAITPQEGIELFKKIIGIHLPQVIISKCDFTSMVLEVEAFNDFGQIENFTIDRGKESNFPPNYEQPRNETEEVVAKCWQEVLGINRISIHEKFTDVGGHSLLAIKIIAMIRDQFDIKLSIKDLFEAPTIASMSEIITKVIMEEIEALSEYEAVQYISSEKNK